MKVITRADETEVGQKDGSLTRMADLGYDRPRRNRKL